MMRRFFVALFVMMMCATSIGAQRRRTVYSNDPGIWVTAALAGFRSNGVNDGATASTWDFGNSTNFQYRASLEKGMSNGSSFGVAGSYASIPFVYSANLAIPLAAGTSGIRCSSCEAHLDMLTAVATFHAGSGYGFHQVVELNGGIVTYRNLKREDDGAKLAGGGNIDPLLALGYGFGYGLNERTNIDFMSDYAFAIHERKGLSNGVSNTNSMPGLRVLFRMGFGGRNYRR